MSIDYAAKNKIEGKDWRRIIFTKQLELLSNINEKYYQLGEKMLDEILENNPYNDELLG